MSKDRQSICVTIRVRPHSQRELEEDSRFCLRADESANSISMSVQGEKQAKEFLFDSVCDRKTQEEIFQKVGQKSTQFCMEGYNCTIFAYGQTGAGKTFTMMGVNQEHQDYHNLRGLIPRTLQHLFQRIEQEISETGVDYIIKCSFIEIYNEQIIDLLGNANSILGIREDIKKGVYIEGVTEQIISRSEEAMDILSKGSKGRHVGSTFYNEASSRSHSVFTMQIDSQKVSNGIKSTKSRHFHFIDLAGSERTKKSAGERLREGCSINKSLHVLSTVIGSLAEVSEGKARHINYRDSKLTFLLKDSLGGNSKTHLIANISPSWVSSQETRSTLIFARKVKLIKVSKVSINQDSTGNLESLKMQIKRLKSEIILLRNGAMRPAISTDTMGSASGQPKDTKMVMVLQQYVDEELEKQTKLELELSKLNSNNSNLQKGLKQLTQNEQHYKMIIAIYESKLERMCDINKQWVHKYESLKQSEKILAVQSYFENEREKLLEEVKQYKKMSESAGLVKTLLKELKLYKQETQNPNKPRESNLLEILTKNNEFLQEISQCIEREVGQATLSQEPASVQNFKQMQEEKRSLEAKVQDLSDELEKRGITETQNKDKIEEYEYLLEQAVKAQINLEAKLSSTVSGNQINEQTIKKSLEEQQAKTRELNQQNERVRQQNNLLSLKLSECELNISKITSELKLLREKQEHHGKEEEEKLMALSAENSRLQLLSESEQEQIETLRNEILEIKSDSQCKLHKYEQDAQQYRTQIEDLEAKATKLESKQSSAENRLKSNLLKHQEEVAEKEHQITKMSKDLQETAQKLAEREQKLTAARQHQQVLELELGSARQEYHEQKLKWDDNHKELIKLINQKEETDSETDRKIKHIQLELLESHEKYNELALKNKRMQQSYKQQNSLLNNKVIESQELLIQKMKIYEQTTAENSKNLDKISHLGESLSQANCATAQLQQQNISHEQKIQELEQQLHKTMQRQKQARVLSNQSKNEAYALKKNYEIELSSLNSLIKKREEENAHMEKEILKSRQTHNTKYSELQKIYETELEIYKQNQLSIKNAMETHLENKEKRIMELQEKVEHVTQQYNNKCSDYACSVEAGNELSQKLSENAEELKQRDEYNRKLREQLEGVHEQLSDLQNNNIRKIEELENSYVEQVDMKNGEILRFRDENEALRNIREENVAAITQKQSQLSAMQSALAAKQALIETMQSSLTQQLTAKQSLICNLQQQLTEKQGTIALMEQQKTDLMGELQSTSSTQQLVMAASKEQLQILETEHSSQICQRNKEIQELTAKLLQVSTISESAQQQHKEKYAAIDNEKQVLNGELLALKGRQQSNEQLLRNQALEADQLRSSLDLLRQQRDRYKQQSANQELVMEEFKIAIEGLKKDNERLSIEIQQSKSHCDQLKQEELRIFSRNQQLLTAIEGLEHEGETSRAAAHSMKNQLQGMQQQNEGLVIRTQELQQQISQNKLQFQEHLTERTQNFTSQVSNLNDLYEKLKQQKSLNETTIAEQLNQIESLSNQLQQMQDKYSSLQIQTRNNQGQRAQENTLLAVQCQEQSHQLETVMHNYQIANNELQQVQKQYDQLVEQSDEKTRTVSAEMDELQKELTEICQEARQWKQKTEKLEKEVQLSNERADKHRWDCLKQKEMNGNLKSLVENSECQISQYKLQIEDKDTQYKRLLERLAKYDCERKGNLSQDRKFSELIEKSRHEVNEYKKKYEDQVKVNKILKQEIEKLQVDIRIVRERSEEYCKKQQSLMNSIQLDYSALEKKHNSAENSLKNASMKIEEAETKYKQLQQEYQQAHEVNSQLKREALKTTDERQICYMNKLKEQNTQLKREIQKMKEQLFIETQEKIKLKSERRYGKEQSSVQIELERKNSEIKYLQKIIDDSMTALGIQNSKSVNSKSMKIAISELQRELSRSAATAEQLREELHIKNEKLNIYQKQRTKNQGTSGGNALGSDDIMSRYKNKIHNTSSLYQSMKQSKEEQKSVLQSQDANKSGWNHLH